MNNVNIRKLENKDFLQIREIDNLTLKIYFGDKWDIYAEEEKDKFRKSRKSEFEINVHTKYSFVAEKGNKILGFVFAHETLPFKGTIYIRHIAVHPDYQSQGIGEKLLNNVIDAARANRIKKISSSINIDNPSSIRLHEKVGFKLIDKKYAHLEL